MRTQLRSPSCTLFAARRAVGNARGVSVQVRLTLAFLCSHVEDMLPISPLPCQWSSAFNAPLTSAVQLASGSC